MERKSSVQKSLTVYRNEKKYHLSRADSGRLQEEMQILLTPDAYSKEGSYHVRSLYFDTINNRDFTEKEDPLSKMMRELGLGVISTIKALLPQPGLY